MPETHESARADSGKCHPRLIWRRLATLALTGWLAAVPLAVTAAPAGLSLQRTAVAVPAQLTQPVAQQAQRKPQQAQRKPQQAQRKAPQRAAAAPSQRKVAQRRVAKADAASARRSTTKRAPPRRGPSFGEMAGLRQTEDELDLNSSVALVVDQDTDEVLFAKNADAVLPIASITKLMTALVVAEAGLPLQETLVVAPADAAVRAGNPRATLRAGVRLKREDALHLALMSSENRAAHLLGRTFPGGMVAFVEAMNAKARELGMHDTRYVEPTGLSSDNQSSARDLAVLVRAAYEYPLLRELSTRVEAVMPVGRQQVQFRTTNGLVRSPEWDIGLQKTGFITAAGRCVAMQAELAGRKVILVLLDSAGRYARIGDAERLRKWVTEGQMLRDLGFEPR
jgi:D-alanyl-D-alanine endopeptidase (penicillin-binding protein 7)